ncbi:hypothetical protein ACO2Q8_18965 [Larkinella sp. VNQ87]|uniref:hypothetical protein n=1 Tax=Larkinella sp. VNQ87 TaxID=3400921 RepID=UPI003C04DC35
MKPFLTLFLVATVSMRLAYGQRFDFETGIVDNLNAQKTGEMVKFTVNNVNTFRYKVTIKGSNITYVTPIPTELQTLFRLPEPTQSASKATEGASKAEAAKNDMDKLKVATAGNFRVVMDELVRLCSLFVVEANAVRSIKYRRATLISIAKQNWRNHSTMLGTLPTRFTVPVMQAHVQGFMDAYQKAEMQYEAAKQAAKSTPSTDDDERIESALERFEEGYHDVDEEDLIKLIEDVDLLQNALLDPKNFSVISPAIQAEGDYLAFTISIEPDQTNALLPHEASKEVNVEIPVRKGWKADFSVGSNFSVGYEARDERYYLKPTSDGKGALTRGANSNFLRPGVAAMLHAYQRTGKSYAAGIMMGVGAGFKEENALTAAYYLGGSLVLGKTERLMINGGVSFLQVNRLKAGYIRGDDYPIDSTKIDDLTEKVLRPSLFLGISYNITNRVERN